MKRTQRGIVKRIDRLGRLVIPVNYLKSMGISRDDEVEIYYTGDEVYIRKYNDENKLEKDFNNLVCKYGADKVKEICRTIQARNVSFKLEI